MNTQITLSKALITNMPTVPSFLYIILLVCLNSFTLLANTENNVKEKYSVNLCPTGNVVFVNQDDVDDFVTNYPDCTTISGDLIIGNHILTDNSGIVDLSGLSSITTVTGHLKIQNNYDLLSLDGLHSITTVGADMWLISNHTLASLGDLGALESVDGKILIRSNNGLTNLTGLNVNLSIGGNLIISGNRKLINLSGLEGQTIIQGNLAILSHRDLTDISALESLTSIGGNIAIEYNSVLSSLNGLQALNSIGGNLTIVNNPAIADCNGICQLVNMPGGIGGTITIENNAVGCFDLDEITTICIDHDEDGVPYEDDNCPGVANPNQEDADEDGIGDVCDEDNDNDGCPDVDDPNPLVPPAAVCQGVTLQLDENGVAELSAEEVDAGSGNACEIVSSTVSTDFFDCNQLGDHSATLTITDGGGNITECTANITVTGLPCDFSAPADGVNCTDGNQATYDPNTDAYTITSEGCYDPNYYSNSDSHGFIGTQLCGDGEVIAQITQVNGNGWAGISMREGLEAGAKKLQLAIDGVSMSRRELRQSTGAVAYAHQFPTQSKNWLRLTRSGNTFGAYHSADGTNWQAVLITNIPMTNCIEVGMVTRNSSPSGTLTATFENFEVKSPSSLQAPNLQGVDIAYTLQPTLEVYPNPAKGEAWVRLDKSDNITALEMTIEVYNNMGQVIHKVPNQALEEQRIHLDVASWLPGIYLVQMKADGQPVISKKLIVSD